MARPEVARPDVVVGGPPAAPPGALRRWLSSPRRVLPVTLPLLALVLVGLVAHTGGRHIDLEVYRFGVAAWLAGGDLYGPLPETADGIALPFIYPPFAALLMVPLAVVGWTTAWVALLVASVLALAGTLYLTARSLWPSAGRAGAVGVASLALPLALAVSPGYAVNRADPVVGEPLALEPVLQTIEYGQINLLLMALVAADCLVRRPRWPRGLLIGLAAAIKLTPLAFVLFFLLRRDYRAAAVAAVTGLAATGVGFLVAPGLSLRFWSDPAGGVSGSPFFTNQSVQAVLVRAGVDGGLSTAVWLAICLALLAAAAPVIARAAAPQALMVTAALALLVSPTSWSHHWVWVAPALLVGAATAGRLRSVGWAVGTGLAVAVFVWAPHQRGLPRADQVELTWTPLQQVWGSTYVWFTVAVLLVMAAARWRRARGPAPLTPAPGG